MKPKEPPRLATLLLERFAANDPLTGDLYEEYQAGRSALWYWWQVTFAMLNPLRHTDPHQLFAVQGMFMQCVMLVLTSVCAVFTVKLIGVVVFDETMSRMLFGPRVAQELIRLVLSFAVAIPIGLAIARVHVHSRYAAIVAFSIIVPVWAFVNLYVLDGHGNLDAVLPHVVALVVFITGLLSGGLYSNRVLIHS